MTTFNAGAIEANLTLDRSSWSKDLRLTKKEIVDLENTRITVMLDMDADNALVQMSNFEALAEDLDNETYSPKVDLITRDAEAALAELEARLDRLDARTVTFMVDADPTNAEVQLSLLDERLDELDNDTIDIGIDVDAAEAQAKLLEIGTFVQTLDMVEADIQIDVDGYATAVAQLATLEAQVGLLDGRDIDLDVDIDRSAMRELLGSPGSDGSGGYIGLLRVLIIAIVALLPVLSVMFSTLGAAVVGFAGAMVAALGPLAVLAGGIAGLIMRYKEAVDVAQGADLTGPVGNLQDALERLEKVWDRVLDAIEPAGFQLMADALDLAGDILPTLVPLFNATADAISGVLESIRDWVEGPEYAEMIGFFSGFGVDMLVQFMNILGDLIQFFGRLFDAMEPFIRTMMDGLEGVTQGWADWADELENNQAFQDWLDNALEYGPMVLDMLGSLLDALYNIGQALLPFAGPMLEGLTAFFDFIANMDTDVLTVVVAAIGGLFLGMNVLVPLVTALIGGLGMLSTILGVLIGPVGLIIAVVGLLAYAIYDLWQNNETFREAVITTWETIRDTVGPIIMDIWDFLKENWGPIKAFVLEIWGYVQGIIVDAMVSIRQITRGVMAAVSFIWHHFGDDILNFAKWVWGNVASIIRGAFQIIRGIFQIFRGILTADTQMMWEGIKNIWRGAVNVLRGTFGALGEAVFRVLEWIREQFNRFIGWLGGLAGRVGNAVSGIWDGLGDAFANMLNAIIRAWNNFSLTVNIPDKIPGLPDSFTVNTPDVGYIGLARGAWVTEPTLAVVGEGGDNELVAPEPMLREIVRENSGGNLDYDRLAAVFVAALAQVAGIREGITREDLLNALAVAGMKIDIDASGQPSDVVRRMVAALGFELRRMGFGGKRYA